MKLTPEQLNQNAAAMIAFAEGKKVERTLKGDFVALHGWRDTDPIWDFENFLYRPKPEPKTRPWNCPDDVPGPVCWIRHKELSLQAMIVNVSERGFEWFTNSDKFVPWKLFADKFQNYQYSTDRKTWHPCTVTE